MSKNRKAELARKQAYLEKHSAKKADAKPGKETPASTSGPKAAVEVDDDEDGDELDEIMGPKLAKRYRAMEEMVGKQAQTIDQLTGRFSDMDSSAEQAEIDRATQELVTELHDAAFELADKAFPGLSKEDRADLNEFIEDKLDRAAKVNQEKGIAFSPDVGEEMARDAIIKARRFIGRLVEAQLRDTAEARAKHKVKPDIGTTGTEAPIDSSKLPREKQAAVQRELSQQAEAYASLHQ
jgi:hypothetical protein